MNLLELGKKFDEKGIHNTSNREKLLLAAISFSHAALLGLLQQKKVLSSFDIRSLDESFDKFVEASIQTLLQEYQDARKRIREKKELSFVSDEQLDELIRETI